MKISGAEDQFLEMVAAIIAAAAADAGFVSSHTANIAVANDMDTMMRGYPTTFRVEMELAEFMSLHVSYAAAKIIVGGG